MNNDDVFHAILANQPLREIAARKATAEIAPAVHSGLNWFAAESG
jgi:hypothetical protein